MRCPKCGFDNPADTLFCEECDWRLDQIYKGEKKRNPMLFSLVALALGLVSFVSAMFIDEMIGIGAGVIGMVLSGYAFNLPRYIPCNKGLCTGMAAIGILLNILGFIFGLASM